MPKKDLFNILANHYRTMASPGKFLKSNSDFIPMPNSYFIYDSSNILKCRDSIIHIGIIFFIKL